MALMFGAVAVFWACPISRCPETVLGFFLSLSKSTAYSALFAWLLESPEFLPVMFTKNAFSLVTLSPQASLFSTTTTASPQGTATLGIVAPRVCP